MKAPVKVLAFCLVVAIALIVVVFYRYHLIEGIDRTSHQDTQINKTNQATDSVPAQTNSDPQPHSMASTGNSSQSLSRGKQLYEEKTCVLCHGATGKADTATGQAMKATNLTTGQFQNNSGNMERTAYILQVIENGVPGTAMASFKTQIPNEQDRKDLANYVNSLSKSSVSTP